MKDAPKGLPTAPLMILHAGVQRQHEMDSGLEGREGGEDQDREHMGFGVESSARDNGGIVIFSPRFLLMTLQSECLPHSSPTL